MVIAESPIPQKKLVLSCVSISYHLLCLSFIILVSFSAQLVLQLLEKFLSILIKV